MTDEEFKIIRDEIYKLTGIYYADNKKYLLEGRLLKRLSANNLDDFRSYLKLLKSSSNSEELHKLFDAITINETYFFRAEQQFEALIDVVAPEIIEKKLKVSPNPFFRVWSAACSSGEEPYTIAMMMKERLSKKYPTAQFQIVGSDINREVLEKAKRGIYKEYSVKNVPSLYMDKYFKKQANGLYALSDDIKRLVKFAPINLYKKEEVRKMANVDVIFCANVLIYFDPPSKERVVSNLYDALNRGGYLFIGYSESLHGVSKAFKLVHLPKCMAYKKE